VCGSLRLENFLWLLIWAIVYASEDTEGEKAANRGIQVMLEAWSGDVISNRSKPATADHEWGDAVFGGLIKGIFGKAPPLMTSSHFFGFPSVR
jgi:hypothetical protein